MAELLDFADEISQLIPEADSDRFNYFMTLIYIEDILDKYGRGPMFQEDPEAKTEAIRRMDLLRGKIREYSETYNFDDNLKQRTDNIFLDWRRRAN